MSARKYVRPPGTDGSAFYHTCGYTDEELFANYRAIMGVKDDWTCIYCNCVNKPENEHCCHRGAPHIEKKTPESIPTPRRSREIWQTGKGYEDDDSTRSVMRE